MRDISHRHQHHSPDSDTILVLQKHEDNTKWRANVLFSLHHYIIRTKRFSEAQSLYRCVGVLAYATSFRMTCNRFLQNYDTIPPFNEEELLLSLNARIGEQTHQLTESGVYATIRLGNRVVLCTLLAAAVAVIAIFLQPQIESAEIPELKKISELVGRHILPIAAGLAILFGLAWIVTADRFIKRRLFRDILEASNVKRRRATYAIFAAAIMIFLLTYWISYSAISDLIGTILDFWNSFQL